MEPKFLSGWSSEFLLCAELCRRDGEGFVTEGPIDWSELSSLASSHRVETLVGLALRERSGPPASADVDAWFGQRIRQQEFRSLRTQAAAVQAVGVLEACGIPSLLLKGPAVSHRYYGNPSARQNLDVDLLIPSADVPRARLALAAAGYANGSPEASCPSDAHHGTYMRLVGAVVYWDTRYEVPIDLHWHAVHPLSMDWSYSALQGYAETVELGGRSLKVLDDSAQFLYLIYHGAKHRWERLKWLADIDRIVPLLSTDDIQKIWERTRRDRTEDIVVASLEFYGSLFRRDLKQFDLASRKKSAANVARLVNYMRSAMAAKPFDDMSLIEKVHSGMRYQLYLWRWRRDCHARRQLIVHMLADRYDVQRLRLSERWLWLYAAAGPFLVIVKFFERRWAEFSARKR